MRAVLLALCMPSVALAVPNTLAHQGRLLDIDGSGLNTTEDMTFRIYSASVGTSALFTEPVDDVALLDGYYSVQLGTNPTYPLQADDLDGGARYLGITVGLGNELSPRTPLASVPYAIHAQNVVAIDAPSTCGAGNAGAMQLDTASGTLEVCSGTAWVEVSGQTAGGGSQNAAQSCAAALAAGNTTSGVYWIDPDNSGAFQTWCDMLGENGDGGGWTLVAKTNGSGQNHWQDADTNVAALTSPSTTTSASLGNDRRSTVGQFYRISCGSVTSYGYLHTPSALSSANWNGSSIFAWNSSYSTTPAAYTTASSGDCSTVACPGPANAFQSVGRNWMRLSAGGCGIGEDTAYGHTGTMWVK